MLTDALFKSHAVRVPCFRGLSLVPYSLEKTHVIDH